MYDVARFQEKAVCYGTKKTVLHHSEEASSTSSSNSIFDSQFLSLRILLLLVGTSFHRANFCYYSLSCSEWCILTY